MALPLKASWVWTEKLSFSPVDQPPRKFRAGWPHPALVGVAGTGQVDHIRRHGFACGKSRGSCPYEHAQAHEQGHEQGQRLSQCFHRVTSLKWPQKSTSLWMCCLRLDSVYVLKKRGAPGVLHLIRSVCQTCGFLKESASPNIFFFRLFRWYEGVRCGEGEQRKHRFPANRRTAPLVVDYLSKLRWRLR